MYSGRETSRIIIIVAPADTFGKTLSVDEYPAAAYAKFLCLKPRAAMTRSAK